MHEAVQDGGGHGGIAQVSAPVLHNPVGGDDDRSAQLVALVHQGLQELGGVLADAPGQEEVVEDQQVGRHPALEQACALIGIGQRVSGELAVGLDVSNTHGPARWPGRPRPWRCGSCRCRACRRSGRCSPVAEELQVQKLEAGRARQLRVEAPVEVGQGRTAHLSPDSSKETFHLAAGPSIQFVLQHRRHRYPERVLGRPGPA